jgi:NAD(P)-dependent dehydrogenase (short-subunit alcohol dehydrogenase family)
MNDASTHQPSTRGHSPAHSRIAVVTGASAGIGRAIAEAFADAGFDVALLARGQAGLDGAADAVRAKGQRALAIPTDVSDHGQVAAAAARIEAEFGEIDVWVNDAMTTVFAPAWEVKPADFERAIDVTFLGQVWGTLVALDYMRQRNRGNIVNIGSALAFLGIPLQSAYCASKFACRGFFESVRAELLHEGSNVQIGMVHPPAVNTPQFDWCETTMEDHPQPVPPIYQPEVVARYVVQAALDGRRSKVVGSWNRLVVAAGKLVPGYGNQYASIGAWETQLTSQPVKPDRPVNLYDPADDELDMGARGQFSDKAGGFFDPSFLKSLPQAASTLAQAGINLGREKISWVGRTDSGERLRLAGSTVATVVGLIGVRRLASRERSGR